MFGAMATDMYLPSFPLVAKSLGVHIASVQLTLTTFFIGMGIGQLLYGPISDRYGRKRPMYVGVTLFVIASLMCATATTLPTLLVWRFFQALGGAGGVVIARAIIRDRFVGIALARAMTIMGMVFGIAPAIAPTIGSTILRFGSWHWIFIGLAAFGVYALIGSTTVKESHPVDKRTDHGIIDAFKTYIEIIQVREFLIPVATACSGSMLLFGYIASSPEIFMGHYRLTSTQFGLLFGLNSLGLIVAGQVNLKLLPKFGIDGMLKVFTRIQILSAALVLIACLTHASLWFLYPPLMVAMGSMIILFANNMTIAMTPFPHRAGSAAALTGFLQTFSAAAVAAILAAFHIDATFKMGFTIIIGSTFAFALVRLRSRA